jgi:hypothetical protein
MNRENQGVIENKTSAKKISDMAVDELKSAHSRGDDRGRDGLAGDI